MASGNAENFGISILLEDLLIEIFLRSCVKSILRAKCKHWYDLIKNYSFEHKYLEYQKNRNQNCLLLQYFVHESEEVNYTILDDIHQSSTLHHPLEYKPGPSRGIQYIEGPVNGVYCLFDSLDRIVLRNPAVMDFKIVPPPPLHQITYYEVSLGYIGFGINHLTNDYNVILFRGYFDPILDYPVFENHVATLYNLTTNTWRPLDLDDLDIDYNYFHGSSFIKGTYYWCVDSGDVLAFDMKNETFQVIPGPDISEVYDVNLFSGRTAVYEERVALLRNNELFVIVWVMLEEGIWIKQFSIGPLPGLVFPIMFWKKEGIFLIVNDSDSEPEPDSVDPNSRLVLYEVSIV